MTGQNGYAGKIMRVDLSSGTITDTPTANYTEKFAGARGIGTKIYWDEVSPEIGAFDPENRLILITGPTTGIPPLGSRTQIYGKTQHNVPDGFCYSNFGGSWGAFLKFAGFDGLVVQGKAKKPVYLYINDGTAEIRDASDLWGQGALEVNQSLKQKIGSKVKVVAIGPAGENMVRFANLMADEDASGSGGFGAVMGSKNLKAIAVTGSGKVRPADKEKIRELTKYLQFLMGTEERLDSGVKLPPDLEDGPCYGCISCRLRQIYEAKDGTRGKVMCFSYFFYQDFSLNYHGEWNEAVFFANRLCDQYGLDITPMMLLTILLQTYVGSGILKEEDTELPISKIGSLEYIEAMAKMVAFRDGFGDVLAQGPSKLAQSLGKGAEEILAVMPFNEYGTFLYYCPRLYITTGLMYAMEPRHPQQLISEVGGRLQLWNSWAEKKPGAYWSSEFIRAMAKRFWGNELGSDYSTYEWKPQVAVSAQDRITANDCGIFCLYTFPLYHSPSTEDYVGDPTIESQFFAAITGRDIDEEGWYRIGERVFNLQRAIMAREGHRGRESDILPEYVYTQPLAYDVANDNLLAPGKDGEIISRKGEVLERDKFEAMKDEYYALRGWDVATGLQTKTKLEELELQDIIPDLEARGLVV
ncbi:aldehyde ferredoxin oxidoreductase N-terminal domain-containing protein [Chloroflexota bacterium]